MRLNPNIDTDGLARRYAAESRIVIEDFLEPASADALHHYLSASDAWRHVLNSGDKFFEIARADHAAMPASDRARLDEAVIAAARSGFQYRYDSIRVPDEAAARARIDTPAARFAELMCAPQTLALLQSIIGDTIDFVDAQATAYRPGDFLTAHDDAVAGKGRRAAYVLGLTPAWRPEWGGLLVYHGGATIEGVVPGFNRLTLFRVPQVHSVSWVTPSAVAPRYSITGWLRRTLDDPL